MAGSPVHEAFDRSAHFMNQEMLCTLLKEIMQVGLPTMGTPPQSARSKHKQKREALIPKGVPALSQLLVHQCNSPWIIYVRHDKTDTNQNQKQYTHTHTHTENYTYIRSHSLQRELLPGEAVRRRPGSFPRGHLSAGMYLSAPRLWRCQIASARAKSPIREQKGLVVAGKMQAFYPNHQWFSIVP